MLRLACSLVTEAGIALMAPIHDAVMIEGPASEIEELVVRAQGHMEEASAVVLDGFRLKTSVKIVCSPDRYMEERGRPFWDLVMQLLAPIPA